MSNDWFQRLFGFAESDYDTTRHQFTLEGSTLRSMANGRAFGVGEFSTPTLGALRERVAGLRRGPCKVTHEIVHDVLELHALPENRGATFQVASQFNCLEFADPREVPEDGVTQYANDPTQGPACALAAAGATVYRNYFAPVGEQRGQTTDRQLNNLDELAAELGASGAFFDVRNGYTWSDETRLARLRDVLAEQDRDALLATIKIGLQSNVDVTFASRYVEPSEPTTVHQAFCSAVSCGYTTIGLDHWEPLATMALDAAYEATLCAAALAADSSNRVWLTFLGGGAFGNRGEWIAGAIGRALRRANDFGLDVRIAHYRRLQTALAEAITDAAAG